MNKYYMRRPAGPGAQPKDVDHIVWYDDPKPVPEKNMLWAYCEVYYDRKLTSEEIYEYELVPENLRFIVAEKGEVKMIVEPETAESLKNEVNLLYFDNYLEAEAYVNA